MFLLFCADADEVPRIQESGGEIGREFRKEMDQVRMCSDNWYGLVSSVTN